MLDIILSNTTFDLGYIFDFGGLGIIFANVGRSEKISDFASTLEKFIENIYKAIDKATAAYENLS